MLRLAVALSLIVGLLVAAPPPPASAGPDQTFAMRAQGVRIAKLHARCRGGETIHRFRFRNMVDEPRRVGVTIYRRRPVTYQIRLRSGERVLRRYPVQHRVTAAFEVDDRLAVMVMLRPLRRCR